MSSWSWKKSFFEALIVRIVKTKSIKKKYLSFSQALAETNCIYFFVANWGWKISGMTRRDWIQKLRSEISVRCTWKLKLNRILKFYFFLTLLQVLLFLNVFFPLWPSNIHHFVTLWLRFILRRLRQSAKRERARRWETRRQLNWHGKKQLYYLQMLINQLPEVEFMKTFLYIFPKKKNFGSMFDKML